MLCSSFHACLANADTYNTTSIYLNKSSRSTQCTTTQHSTTQHRYSTTSTGRVAEVLEVNLQYWKQIVFWSHSTSTKGWKLWTENVALYPRSITPCSRTKLNFFCTHIQSVLAPTLIFSSNSLSLSLFPDDDTQMCVERLESLLKMHPN